VTNSDKCPMCNKKPDKLFWNYPTCNIKLAKKLRETGKSPWQKTRRKAWDKRWLEENFSAETLKKWLPDEDKNGEDE
jgi:hypothetical protein